MKIGDKVVCVEISEAEKYGAKDYFDVYPNWPVVGNVYVIRDILITAGKHFRNGRDMVGLKLVGYTCINLTINADIGFDADRFRLLDEIKKQNKLANKVTKTHVEALVSTTQGLKTLGLAGINSDDW